MIDSTPLYGVIRFWHQLCSHACKSFSNPFICKPNPSTHLQVSVRIHTAIPQELGRVYHILFRAYADALVLPFTNEKNSHGLVRHEFFESSHSVLLCSVWCDTISGMSVVFAVTIMVLTQKKNGEYFLLLQCIQVLLKISF